MEFVPEWAPNIHPMFVHFPIGLLMTAVAIDLVSLFPGTSMLRRAVPVLYGAGALSVIATYFTGEAAAEDLSLSAAAEPVLTLHADYALWTAIFFAAYGILRIAIARFYPGVRLMVRLPLVAIAVAGLFLLWETAERGSEMVYGHGVGVRIPVDGAETLERVPASESVTIGPDGWTLTALSANALRDTSIRWLVGRPEDLEFQADSLGLSVTVTGGTAMFVVERTLENVQLITELDVSSFSGLVSLVHHVRSAETYDYLSVGEGEVRLGRSVDGITTVYESSPGESDWLRVRATGWLRVRATGDGTHFRGYIDNRMVVHGHDDPLSPGPAGMRLEGEGTLRLRLLQARSL